MTLEQFPFRDLVTPAGIAAAAVLIRQIIEMAKHSFLPWLDAGNERKGVFILSAALCAGWLLVYGTDLGRDGFAAVTAFWATATAAIGSNEAVDAAKGVVARNVRDATADDPEVTTVGTAGVDDSLDRSTSIERGPAIDLLVDGGEPAAPLEEPPADPALAGAG
jgi:hypothetical protein